MFKSKREKVIRIQGGGYWRSSDYSRHNLFEKRLTTDKRLMFLIYKEL